MRTVVVVVVVVEGSVTEGGKNERGGGHWYLERRGNQEPGKKAWMKKDGRRIG